MATIDKQHYLSRLLSYANLRVDVPAPQQPDGKRALRVVDLKSTYVQVFSQLDEATNLSVALQPVPQVRVAIGVLRAFMDDQQEPVDLSHYGLAAYESMLQILGTPYEELRLIRAGDVGGNNSADLIDLQTALANRLGIDPSNPTQLQELILQPDAITEEALEEMFGLVSTTRDPFARDARPQPKLLTWQLAWLRELWSRQDDALQADSGYNIPIIDPDLVGESDLRDPTPGNSVFEIWKCQTCMGEHHVRRNTGRPRGRAKFDRGLQQDCQHVYRQY